MATDIIDGALSVPAFPATYTGPGTLIGNIRRSASVDDDMYGWFVSDGNPVQINVGYAPRAVKVIDVAGVLVWEWNYGMAATDSLKFGAAGLAIDTTGAIAVPDLKSGGNGNVTLSAALVGSGKTIQFEIHA